MLDQKTLFILGAGASKSLSDEIKDKKNTFAIGTGYREMPLGWELVQKISKYRVRSVSRFICHIIYQIYSSKPDQKLASTKFIQYSDIINRALKSLYKTDKDYSIEKAISNLFKYEIQNPEERKKIEDFFKHRLNSSGTNSEFVGGFPILINAVSLCILIKHNTFYKNKEGLEDTYRCISEITREVSIGSDIIDLLNFSRISYYENSNITTKTIFGDIQERFKKIINQSEEVLLKKRKYGVGSVDIGLSAIVQALYQKEEARSAEIINFLVDLSNKPVDRIGLDEIRKIKDKIELYFVPLVQNSGDESCDFFLKNALSSVDEMIKREIFLNEYVLLGDKLPYDVAMQKCNAIKDESVLNYTLTSYIVAYMMILYSPSSIDDFVMNFEFYTRYETIHRKNNPALPTAEKIKEHVKYIIACVLLEDFYATMIFTYGCDNYIKFISRLVISGCLNNEKKLKQSLAKLDFINFNYDTTLFALLAEYIPTLSISEYYKSNVIHPYGKLVYVDAKDEEMENPEKIFDNLRVGIWDKFFDKNDFDYTISGAEINVFKQSQKIIDLIREKDNESFTQKRQKMQNKFLDAEVVCFCGFGFDKDNLAYLGLISDDSKKPISEVITKAREKKIYVSSVNNKIIMTLEEVFGCRMTKFAEKSHWDEEKKVYIAKHIWRSEQGRGNIIASENSLNYALNNDFLF